MTATLASQIFVNLPVKDLRRSMDFFTALGFDFDARFTDDNAACLIIGTDKYAMLLVEDFFAGFIPGRQIADAARCAEALIAISASSREAVDATIQQAIAAGGRAYREPMEFGWIYGRAFLDPDGHTWEILYMDESALPDEMRPSA